MTLVFGSAFFLQTSLFVPSIWWQGFEKSFVGAGSVRLKIITEKKLTIGDRWLAFTKNVTCF